MNSSPFFRSPVTQWKRPVEKLSAPLIHTLRFVPGVLSRRCFPLRIPSRSRPWGWSRAWSRPGRKIPPSAPSKGHLRASCAFAVRTLRSLSHFLRRDRTRPPPAKAQAMERAAHCLPARHDGSLLEQLHGQELAAPARSQPSMGGGRILFDQTLDVLFRRLPEQRFGSAPSTIIKGAHPPFPLDEALDEGVETVVLEQSRELGRSGRERSPRRRAELCAS